MQNAMSELIQRHAIEPSFLHRYFKLNAENRFAATQLEFMLWRRGRFIRPQEKTTLLEQFTIEEIENFYEKHELNIPQLQFAITTRCSLQCRDCNAMFPEFNQKAGMHIDLSLDDFRREFDAVMASVRTIRRFMLLGGEPLINKDLPDIVDHSARHPGISAVEIITNGTIAPSEKLLEAVREHAQKVYFHLSNYSSNEALLPRLKYERIINTLKNNGIKHQMSMNLDWNKEDMLQFHPYTQPELQRMVDACWLKRCLQVLGGRLSLCPRLSCGYALGLLPEQDGESVDLRADTGALASKLTAFYRKECFVSCRYCVRMDERVDPAIQRTHKKRTK